MEEELIPVPPELLWDYREAPADLMWRLNRIARWFPLRGRDRRTVRQLFLHRDELSFEPEIRVLIELYEEAWRAREREG
ncbi:MAG: hypothetical protein HYY06_17895 [Deltaproteobacteria bacterium]|nr:hypothetical protein [Deltaproteobacteria bacterium]